MRVLNFKAHFSLGNSIRVKKIYTNGSVSLQIGDIGAVTKVSIENFPDMGLFDLRIIHMSFGQQHVGMEEGIAREYFEIV